MALMARSRNTKSKRPPTAIRAVLGRNVKALRDFKFRHIRKITDRNDAVRAATGIAVSQVNRIINGDSGASIDYVEYLAELFECKPHELLQPYFAADAIRGQRKLDSEPDTDVGESSGLSKDAHTKRDKDQSGQSLQRLLR